MIPKKDTDVINFLTERNVSFAISADKTRSLLDTIKSIKELSVFKDLSGLTTDRLTFESVYCLNNTEEQMPSEDFYANALYFAVEVLTYNTFIIMKNNLLPESFIDKTINTIRWSIINIAGRVSRTARSVYLKLASTADKLNMYIGIREKCVMPT